MNEAADALSRRPDHQQMNSINQANLAFGEQLVNEIKASYVNDRVCRNLLQLFAENEQTDESITLEDGVIYKHKCVYVPDNEDIKAKMLREYHDAPLGGHLGIHKTCERLRRHWYWPRLKRNGESVCAQLPRMPTEQAVAHEADGHAATAACRATMAASYNGFHTSVA